MALVVLVVLVASACTTGGQVGSNTPSTIAPGSPWLGTLATVTLPSPVNSLTALDCVTSRHCWAVGSTVGAGGAPNGATVIATADGGATWTAQPIPATVGYLSGISCSDRRHCTAVGQTTQTSNGQGAIIATANGGSTWNAATLPPGILDITAVNCQRDLRCLAIGTTAAGTAALVASTAQPGWVQVGSLPPPLTGATSISCPDAQHCWVTAHVAVDVDHVAGQVAVTTNGGATWATTAAPSGVGYLNDIVCARGTGASGPPPSASTTSSSNPGPAASPPTTTAPPPSTTTTTEPAGVPGAWCAAVGTSAATVTGTRTGHGVVLTTTNGGTTWSPQSVAPGVATLMGVSCTDVNSCVAAGSAVALEPQAGVVVLTGSSPHPWKKAAGVFAPQALTAVSCTSTSRCVIVGESVSQRLVGG